MSRTLHISYKTLSLFALGTLLASPLMAAPAPKEQAYSGWSWSAHLGSMNIDSKVAEAQGINSSAWVFGAAAERYSSDSILTFVIGLDLISYDDYAEFRQNTTGGRKKSNASGGLGYIEFGPKVDFGKNNDNYFVAHAGLSAMFSSSRSIDYCSDCYSESIDVNGGFYGVLGVGHTFNNFDLGLQFQQYFSGDLDNSLRVRISTSF
jgi:hypothetical protein